jgi:hypothetical protein
MEEDLLPAAGEESTGVIPKEVPTLNKGRVGISLSSLHIFIWEITLGEHMFEHVQF